MRSHALTFLLLFPVALAVAQPPTRVKEEGRDSVLVEDRYIRFYNEDDPLKLNEEEEEDEPQKRPKGKRPKKRVYYGMKTRRGFARTGAGGSTTILFHFLKEPRDPDPYIQELWWFNTQNRKIESGDHYKYEKNKDHLLILHGPYREMYRDTILMEEGIFYIGTKHGRWTYWEKPRDLKVKGEVIPQQTLLGKEKYIRGWPKANEVTYYDPNNKQVKEIRPHRFDDELLEGHYYRFFPSGRIAEQGDYRRNQKIGKWTEYYDKGKRYALRKRELLYPAEPGEVQAEPEVLKEWDESGKLVINNTDDRY